MVHKATSSAPEIERVIEETRKTPFTSRITNAYLRDTGKIRLPTYEGNTCPKAHIRAFRLAIIRAHFNEEEREAGYCRLFVENLEGSALEWFSGLEENSIDDFTQLSSAFLKQYSIFIEAKASIADLWTLSQGPEESLRSYIYKFKEIKAKIANLNDEVALQALRHGLWYNSPFKRELTVREPTTLEDALHRSARWAIMDEEDENLSKRYNENRARSLNPQGARKENPSQGQHSYSVDSPSGQMRNSYDPNKYCAHHKTVGHSTEECRTVGRLLAAKFAAGELEGIDLTEEDQMPINKRRRSPPKRERTPDSNPESPPPAPKKRIDLIFSELSICGGSATSAITPPPAPKKPTGLCMRRPRICGGTTPL